MAISKILHIGECRAGYSGKYLKRTLDYIAAKEKTGGGKWVGSLNCQPEKAYEQMRQTKEQFGKTDKRQGYHLIISFMEGEVDAATAFEIIGKFAKEYLGADYETLYAVHDNTDHIHGHLAFNSVSFRTGLKYRYQKGDWAKEIQPITNQICEEYGLSTIEISEEHTKPSEHYKEWNEFRDGKSAWSDMIKRDLDAAILQAPTYESFLTILNGMGYEIKNAYRSEGTHLAIKPMGMTRFRRCKSLGDDYTEERIRERILTEHLSTYQPMSKKAMPKIIRLKYPVKRYRRAKLSGIQKRYFARLYRAGLLKKRPYSQAWKYRDEIKKMAQLQEDYLFLSRNNINSISGVTAAVNSVADKKKETSKEKSRIFKERARTKPLFDIADEINELNVCESCYQQGEILFKPEHERWQALSGQIKKEGYNLEQLKAFREHYRNEIAWIHKKEKEAVKEERTAKRILKELVNEESTRVHEKKPRAADKKKEEGQDADREQNKNEIIKTSRQPR